MDPWLNKLIFSAIFLSFSLGFYSQDKDRLNEKDYKDPKQFQKFRKRRQVVGAWQINELKDGALVVRLASNKKLIDALHTQGQDELAEKKLLEQYAINRNTMFAYLDNFKFCKLYFMYGNSSDSLLNGVRSGIFLDTNLNIDPSISMKEKFYLIAERDRAVSSSIGFVREDSAKRLIERGTPVKVMAVIIKNKFGHQLKSPFPYLVKEKNFMNAAYDFPIGTQPRVGGGISINFVVDKTFLEDLKKNEGNVNPRRYPKTANKSVNIPKELTYEKISFAIEELDQSLNEYYRSSPKPDLNKVDPAIIPFLY